MGIISLLEKQLKNESYVLRYSLPDLYIRSKRGKFFLFLSRISEGFWAHPNSHSRPGNSLPFFMNSKASLLIWKTAERRGMQTEKEITTQGFMLLLLMHIHVLRCTQMIVNYHVHIKF